MYIIHMYNSSILFLVKEAYTAAMYSMARLNKTGAELMHSHGKHVHADCCTYMCVQDVYLHIRECMIHA